MMAYFENLTAYFDLNKHYKFEAKVPSCTTLGGPDDGWRITWQDENGAHTEGFAGHLIANGTPGTPNMPEFKGDFSRELIHSSAIRRNTGSQSWTKGFTKVIRL